MSTLCNTENATNSAAASYGVRQSKNIVNRIAGAWIRFRDARTERRLDRHLLRAPNAQERFLSKATDHYDLERLELEWARRQADPWRSY